MTAQAQQAKAKGNVMRTIERLQPGKAKGNLIQNVNKAETETETLICPVASKAKDVKCNALTTETSDGAPKLSLGTVIKTQDFALGKTLEELAGKQEKDSASKDNDEEEPEANTPLTPTKKLPKPFEALLELSKVSELSSKTAASAEAKEKPNLSAWLKAFGGPKVNKKNEDEKQPTSQGLGQDESRVAPPSHSPASGENNSFSLPPIAMRTRKPSTGSTNSERSSFSQDPDSPRIAIDERYGSYAAGSYTSPICASPIGASPIMVSPKPNDDMGKPASPYTLNGAIKVGFYQDTTTKSSPDKSCSPREMNSPYPQYSQHIYSSASSPNVSTPELSGTSPYGGGNSYNPSGSEASKTPAYSSTSPLPIYDQYKQPRSQESDYNSSMSPSTPNPHSPYQQPQSSPYTTSHSTQLSPYHHSQSPYHQSTHTHPQQQQTQQPSHSPSAQQALSPMPSSVDSPASSAATQPPTPLAQSPAEQQHSPYQQPVLSPYQQQVVPPVVPAAPSATTQLSPAAVPLPGKFT